MAIPELPLEIIIAILETAYYRLPDRSSNAPDHRTLSTCSLVHSSWKDSAQELLFRHITFDEIARFSHYASTIDGSLLNHVKILDANLTVVTHLQFITAGVLAVLLSRCPQVYELNLKIHGFHTLRPNSKLLHANNPIRSLRILECSVQCYALFELLETFPTVQFLFIGVEIVASPHRTPLPDLHLYELTMQRALRPDILSWLLASSTDSLRILELRDLPSSQTSQILQQLGPRLESLRLLPMSTRFFDLIKSCAHLKELAMLNMPKAMDFEQLLPKTLEHLTVVNHGYTTGVSWQPVIDVLPSLSHLRVFSCDETAERGIAFAALEAACKERHIHMRRIVPRLWLNDDPIFARHYPRRRSLSNLMLNLP